MQVVSGNGFVSVGDQVMGMYEVLAIANNGLYLRPTGQQGVENASFRTWSSLAYSGISPGANAE